MIKHILLSLAAICSLRHQSKAQSPDIVRKSTDIIMFVPSTAAFISTLALKDYNDTKELVISGATTASVTYLLKYMIKKQRPDGSDDHSFPSNHTAVSFQGATFIAQKYGWKYAIPAYLVSGYVGWGRIYSKRHDGWDVLGGTMIGTGSIIVNTFLKKKNKFDITPVVTENGSIGIYTRVTF